MTRPHCLGALCALLTACALFLAPTRADAAGFEVGENTTKSVARGGTGVALKHDPSALYFNPALLGNLSGFQVLINSNFVDLDVEFERDDLFYVQRNGQPVTRSFEPATNAAGPFPAPFLSLSWDLGIENFSMALGLFGPSAYGHTCYGEFDDDGECVLGEYPEGGYEGTEQRGANAARHMLLESELLEVYATLGAGYGIDLGPGRLNIGAALALAYQNNDFALVIDAEFPSAPPSEELPEEEAIFRAENLTGIRPTGFVGVSYAVKGIHLGVSYRPPIRWEVTGTGRVELPPELQEATGARLTDNDVTLRLNQAGSLRAGIGVTKGTHPRFEGRPRLELEANVVWEDWSRVETFEVDVAGDLELAALGGTTLPLESIEQSKFWQDIFSMRLGGAYALNRWVTASAGVMLESAAQPLVYTSADFLTWERTGLGAGATVHATDWLDVDLGYMYIHMPERDVTNGRVYNEIPQDPCTGPDYDDPSCAQPGVPPGNIQNNGTWRAAFQTASVGLTLHFD